MPDNPRILLHNHATVDLAKNLLAAFPQADFQECNSYAALPGALNAYRPDIVYTVRFDGSFGFPRDALFARGGPVWIANGGAGTDHFGTWDTSCVTVTNSAGVAADMMAEYVFGGFLHFTLDVPGLQSDKSAKMWAARKVRPMFGKTILIGGLGHTGQAIAARAKAFGMRVIGTRARPQPMQNVDVVYAADVLPELLPQADFIAVSTPLTPQTKGLIAAPEIAKARNGAIVADVSRGGVVDQAALHNALRNGQLAGAILDVFETEPLPLENPLWELDNVIISPHCSSVYEGWEDASFGLFLKNLSRWNNGQSLMNVVDPELGY